MRKQGGDALLLPSETGVTPIRPDNLWKREVRPRLEQVGLEWVNFQVLRWTNASLLRKAKVDDKTSADQRGHGLGVSLGVYAISDLDQKLEAVTWLESEVAVAPGAGRSRQIRCTPNQRLRRTQREKSVKAWDSIPCKLLKRWSGRPGSNRRPTAWKAETLPLSYSRIFNNLAPICLLHPNTLGKE